MVMQSFPVRKNEYVQKALVSDTGTGDIEKEKLQPNLYCSEPVS